MPRRNGAGQRQGHPPLPLPLPLPPWLVFLAVACMLSMLSARAAAQSPQAFAYVQPAHTGTATVLARLRLDAGLPRTLEEAAAAEAARQQAYPNLLFYNGFYTGPADEAPRAALVQRLRATAVDRHRTVQSFVALLGEAEWDELVTFSFVRSPFERVLSAFAWTRVVQGTQEGLYNMTQAEYTAAFRAWMRSAAIEGDLAYLRSQCDALRKADGSLGVDFVGRTARLQHDYDRVCREQLHLVPGVFNKTHCVRSCPRPGERDLLGERPERAAAAKVPWQLYYDRFTWDFVVRKYACDIETWFPHLRRFRAKEPLPRHLR